MERFMKVMDGLYRGGAPTLSDIDILKTNYNIKKIVSLDESVGNFIDNKVKSLKIKHIIIPLTYNTNSIMKLLSYDLRDLLLTGGPIFVHCLHGKDRTGLAVALLQCKYLGKDPESAINEAKSFGMGLGLDPNIIKFYEKMIRLCKSNVDVNNADIVSNVRSSTGDTKDSYLDQAQQKSFAPYIGETRQYPIDDVYKHINDQSPTRENYNSYKNVPDKTMNFSEEEYEMLNNRIISNKPIYVTHISGKYNLDDIVGSPFGLLKIIDITTINDVKDHPFYEKLTEDQRSELSDYEDMDIIKLLALHIPYNNEVHDTAIVGLYNNDSGIRGAGPTEPVGGFISD